MQTEFYKELRRCGHNVPKDYRQRARTVIEILLDGVKIFAPADNWKEPSDELMENFIDNFHHIMNWALNGKGKKFYLPLTEEQLKEIEDNLAANLEAIACLTGMLLTEDLCEE